MFLKIIWIVLITSLNRGVIKCQIMAPKASPAVHKWANFCWNVNMGARFDPDYPRTSANSISCGVECETRGKTYFWCHKNPRCKEDHTPSWDYCSPEDGLDYKGKRCSTDHQCGKHGYDYYWCRLEGGSWGYCSPNLDRKENHTIPVEPCKSCTNYNASVNFPQDHLIPILSIGNTSLFTGVFYTISNIKFPTRYLQVSESYFVNCGLKTAAYDSGIQPLKAVPDDSQWLLAPTDTDGVYMLRNKGTPKYVMHAGLVQRSLIPCPLHTSHVSMEKEWVTSYYGNPIKKTDWSNNRLIISTQTENNTFELQSISTSQKLACLFDKVNKEHDHDYLQTYWPWFRNSVLRLQQSLKNNDFNIPSTRDASFNFKMIKHDLSAEIYDFKYETSPTSILDRNKKVDFISTSVVNNPTQAQNILDIGHDKTFTEKRSFGFKESLKMFYEVEWEASVPLVTTVRQKSGVDVEFEANQHWESSESKTFKNNLQIRAPPCSSFKVDYYYNYVKDAKLPFKAKMRVTGKGSRMTVDGEVCECRNYISGNLIEEQLRKDQFRGKILQVQEFSVLVEISGEMTGTYGMELQSTSYPNHQTPTEVANCKALINKNK